MEKAIKYVLMDTNVASYLLKDNESKIPCLFLEIISFYKDIVFYTSKNIDFFTKNKVFFWPDTMTISQKAKWLYEHEKERKLNYQPGYFNINDSLFYHMKCKDRNLYLTWDYNQNFNILILELSTMNDGFKKMLFYTFIFDKLNIKDVQVSFALE